MSNGDEGPRVQADGTAGERARRRGPGPVLLVLGGLVVLLAFGVLAASSRDSPLTEGQFPSVPTSGPTAPAPTIDAQRARELAEVANPSRFAAKLDCGDAYEFQNPSDWGPASHFAGPIAFYRMAEVLPSQGWNEMLAIVEPADSVTMVVPLSERGIYSLTWDPATWRDSEEYSVNDGGSAVILTACDDAATLFVGGFITDRAYCAPLDLYFGDSAEPERIILSFGDAECSQRSGGLTKPEPGPIPDVTGMTLRDARLRLRLVGLDPAGDLGDLQPGNLVWAQEPDDGNTHEPGTVVGLRSCHPADHVAATYQYRLDTSSEDTGVQLSHPWMARNLDPDLDSWFFVSAFVSGGPSDGKIATWALPGFGGDVDSPERVDPVNTPGLSTPANPVAQSLPFGDRRLAPEDYGVSDWFDLDGAIASQRCVELDSR